MPWYKIGGAIVHINFGRAGNKKAPPPCSVCYGISTQLCDYVLRLGAYGESVTCDRPLCEACSSSPAPGKDLCSQHDLSVRAWLAGRTNTTDGGG